MKFIFADALDMVDPQFDFIADESPRGRKPYWDDEYPHQLLGYAPYDGVLISRGIVGDHRFKGKYTVSQSMRFSRVGAREFLRLTTPSLRDLPIYGDCGAFSYVDFDRPPYKPEEMIEFYEHGGFTHGCSVDHIIFEFEKSARGMEGGSTNARERFDITLENANEFLKIARKQGSPFTPLGVVQGWSPGSKAEAAKRLVAMGYDYIAIGGMVPLKASAIHACMEAIAAAIPSGICVHLLGFAKAEQIDEFAKYNITSFDTTSPLIRAFKDARANYYLARPDGSLDYYMAIRVPQALENLKLMKAVKMGRLKQDVLVDLEAGALKALREYDKGSLEASDAAQKVLDYSKWFTWDPTKSSADNERVVRKMRDGVERTLRDRPWKLCSCPICKAISIEVVLFRGNNRNRRRGFHNLTVFSRHVKSALEAYYTDSSIPMTKFVYRAVRARQSAAHHVLSFAARAKDIKQFADIDHAGRTEDGQLRGFQRPQIAAHIKDIRHYLSQGDSVLPNPIVIAFTHAIRIRDLEPPFVELEIDANGELPGFVVDGQQRLSALYGLPDKDFEVFVSALICENYDELRRQFILINNTRPLPKSLIYELLPSVSNLPAQFSSRTFAAALTEKLNFNDSSLTGRILQHTNPTGVIKDTAIQKVIMTSAENGALREIASQPDAIERAFNVISDYYEAVQRIFTKDWEGHTPRTSRLVHGAGIRSMGYVMDLLWERNGARNEMAFRDGLKCLVGHTAWTSGTWRFSDNEIVPWNAIQNIDKQINGLAHYLVNVVRKADRPPRAKYA